MLDLEQVKFLLSDRNLKIVAKRTGVVYETLRRASIGLHEPSYDSLKKISDYLENPFNYKDEHEQEQERRTED